MPKDYDQDFVSFRNSISEKGKETVSSLKNLFNKETDGFKNEVDKSKSSIFGVIEESLNKTENIAGKILGVESDQIINDSDLLIKSLAYLIKTNTPLSFIIKNPFINQTDQKEINYQIDWGDGQKENGNLKEGQSKTISHTWSEEGDYFVRFEIIAADLNTFNYQIKVSAIK